MTFLLQKFIFGGILLVLFLAAIPDTGPFFYPVGRALVFQIIAEIITLLYLILAALDRSFLPRLSILTLALISFLGANVISTLFSLQPSLSFWGDPIRSMGLFSQIHYVLFFLVASSTIRSWKTGLSLLHAAILLSIPLSFFAIVQKFFANVAQAYGTLGNPNFFGAYLILLIFLTVTFAILEKRTAWKTLLISALGAQIIALILSFSRGAYLGLFAGTTLFVFLIPPSFFPLRIVGLALYKHTIRLVYLLSILVFLLMIAGAQFEPPNGFLKHMPGIHRILKVSLSEQSASGRFEMWAAGLEAFKKRPILGFGPENYSIAYDAYYHGTFDHLAFAETWGDRAHNIFIDTVSQTGLLGFVSYFGIFASAFLLLTQKESSETRSLLKLGFFATLIAYLVQNQFNLDAPVVFMYTYFLFGLIHIFAYKESVERKTQSAKLQPISQNKILLINTFLPIGIIIVAIPFVLISFKFHARILSVNSLINRSDALFAAQKYKEAMYIASHGLNIQTPITHILRYKYGSQALLYATELQGLNNLESNEVIENAIPQVDLLITERPYYTRSYLLGGLLTNVIFENTKDEKYRERAQSYFERGLALSPNRGSLLKGYALLNTIDGKYKDAKKKLFRALALNPNSEEVHWMFVNIYLRQGDVKRAFIALEEAKRRNPMVETEERLLQIAYILIEELKQYKEAIPIYKRLTELYPSNVKYWTSLAVMYKKIGDRTNARTSAEHALSIAPPELRDAISAFLQGLQ